MKNIKHGILFTESKAETKENANNGRLETRKKMKKEGKLIALALMLCFIAALMTGCGSTAENTEIYILYAENENQGSVDKTEFNNAVIEACKNGGAIIHLIEIDGEPYEVRSYTIPERKALLLPSQRKHAAKRYATEILNDCETYAIPIAEEVDYAKAFADIGNNTYEKKDTNIHVLVYGNGLNTAGSFSFCNSNLVMADPEEAVGRMKESGVLPNLSNVDSVSFYGFGSVAGSQERIPESIFKNYRSIWITYLEEAGAKATSMTGGLQSTETVRDTDYPHVSAIDFPEDVAVYDGQLSQTEATVIGEKKIGFVADTDDFLDRSTAIDIAKTLAGEMRTGQWLVVGFTAGDTDSERTLSLSKGRAEAVAKLLVECGVERNRIKALGAGCGIDSDYHQKGLGVGSEAQVNRITVICRADSNPGEKLRQLYDE